MKLGRAASFFGQIPCIFADSEPHLACSLANQHSADIALLVGALDVASPRRFAVIAIRQTSVGKVSHHEQFRLHRRG
jgi:hypothetical protein